MSRAPERPEEIIVGPDESRVTNQAVRALARADEIYQRGGELVEVIPCEPVTRGVIRHGAMVRAAACAEARVRELLAREAIWLGSDGGGGQRQIHPPQWTVRQVMARGTWPDIRPLVAVAEAPTLRPDGSLLDTAGYDAATGIYLAGDVRVEVPEAPGREAARAAIDYLYDVVCDFPFASAPARCAWLAGVVTAAARPAIAGPVPMTLIDASSRAAGKGLLADVGAITVTGREAPRMVYAHDEAEMRKTITALVMTADQIVLLDNVVGELGCPSLDAALTATTWRSRVLGETSVTRELPMQICWWATANNATIGADLSRRLLLVRLEPQCEHPEERTGWRYPRLLEHVRARRAELLSATLTIVRAYIFAGKPDMGLVPMGSYYEWSGLVRSALVWAGEPDPYLTVADVRAADSRQSVLRAMIEAWPADDAVPITGSELIERAQANADWRSALVEWCPPKGEATLPTAKVLGERLRRIRRKIIASHLIDSGAHTKRGVPWVRRAVRLGTEPGDAGDTGEAATLLRGREPFSSHGAGEASPASPASPQNGHGSPKIGLRDLSETGRRILGGAR